MMTDRYRILYDGAICLTVVVAIAATVICLISGIADAYPFLYFMPIILFVSVYPRRGVIFTLLLSAAYILLVYIFALSDPMTVAISTAWFVIFVTIGVVTSSFASSLRDEEQKYNRIFENSQAGIFTFDAKSEIILELNERFARMLKHERGDLVNRSLSVILPDPADRERFVSRMMAAEPACEIELRCTAGDGSARILLVTTTRVSPATVMCSAIDITEKRQAEEQVKRARDEVEARIRQRTEDLTRANEELTLEIQERRRYEEAIRLANKKLNTLSSITRHDILNQITALDMYLNLAQQATTEPAVSGYLDRIDRITKLIQKQIQFTRDYQNIGTLLPQWQDLGIAIGAAVEDARPEGISVVVEPSCNGIEMYADMLLESVFFNLIDNAVHHGERVSIIRFSCRKDPDGLIITCEDNGTGIPYDVKDKIFRREYFRNSGFGLFLVTEILGITGITIRETGEEGKGARFEIICPPGTFRYPDGRT